MTVPWPYVSDDPAMLAHEMEMLAQRITALQHIQPGDLINLQDAISKAWQSSCDVPVGRPAKAEEVA